MTLKIRQTIKLLKEIYWNTHWIKPSAVFVLGYLCSSTNLKFNISLIYSYLLSLSLLCFTWIINNYFDWKFENEKNNFYYVTKKYSLLKKTSMIYFFLIVPLIISIFFIWMIWTNYLTILSFLIFFLIFSVIYHFPPIRLRNRPFLGFIPNLSGIFLYSAGYFLNTSVLDVKFYYFIIHLTALSIIFEFLHQIDHYLRDKKVNRNTLVRTLGIKKSKIIIKITSIVNILKDIIFLILTKEFKAFPWISIFFTIIRCIKINKTLRFYRKAGYLRTHLYLKEEIGTYLILLYFRIT